MTDEKLILKGLTNNLQYTQRVIPHLSSKYFQDKPSQALYLIADNYFRKYGACPSPEVLNIEVEKLNGISQEMYDQTKLLIKDIVNTEEIKAEQDWLVAQTEDFVKERALYNALSQALEISQGRDKKLTKTAIPQILSDALAIDFNVNLGHDYEDSAEEQASFYNSKIERISTGIDILDEITNGGFPRKTLNTFILETHLGKTLLMCNIAASAYMAGANVLYITLEESQNKIRQRIDANLLNIHMDEFLGINEEQYLKQVAKIKAKNSAKLKIQEYPTASVSADTFKILIQEYKLKQGFMPDIILVDYLGICRAVRGNGGENTNTTLQYISEELRGLAQWANAALVTAQQIGRAGFGSSDVTMKDIANSIASMFVADFVIAGSAPDELRQKGMILFNQQKNRHRDVNYKKRFMVGVDTSHMRVYELDDPNLQFFPDIDTPIMDNTPVGKRLNDKAKKFGGLT